MAMRVENLVTVGFAFEQLTISNSVQVLTPAKYKPIVTPQSTSGGALRAFLTNESAAIRYTYDGTTPSSTVGHLLPDGGVLLLEGQNQMSQFKCFRQGSSDSVISISYERQ